MPAIAITKNMPVVPERPKRSSTTEEMMMVSMVMPEAGLLAVVAIALAATEVKKNENSSVSTRPNASTVQETWKRPKKTATQSAPSTTPEQYGHHRNVAVSALRLRQPRRGGTRAAQCRTIRQRRAAI